MQIKQLLGNKLGIEIVWRRKWGNGAILTPPGIAKMTNEAIVRYVGEGYKGSLRVGDRVFYDEGRGETLEIEGKRHLLIPADGILARINPSVEGGNGNG